VGLCSSNPCIFDFSVFGVFTGMDEALDADNTIQLSTKGQEDWQMNLATRVGNVPYATKKKEIATS